MCQIQLSGIEEGRKEQRPKVSEWFVNKGSETTTQVVERVVGVLVVIGCTKVVGVPVG